jgi:hypothetical protein
MPLRFTIRDLLWLTVVVALAVAWWVDHHDLIRYKAVYSELFKVNSDRQVQKKLHDFLAEPRRYQLDH